MIGIERHPEQALPCLLIAQRHAAAVAAGIADAAGGGRLFMRRQHVNPEEAVRIFQDCGAERALGHHFGTFQLTDEAIDAPVEALCLEADDLAEAPRRSGSLFGDPQADHEGWLRLLERLRAAA